jgi:hypothetical protein
MHIVVMMMLLVAASQWLSDVMAVITLQQPRGEK